MNELPGRARAFYLITDNTRPWLYDHERFHVTASYAPKHRYLDSPLANEWLLLLSLMTPLLWPSAKLKPQIFGHLNAVIGRVARSCKKVLGHNGFTNWERI